MELAIYTIIWGMILMWVGAELQREFERGNITAWAVPSVLIWSGLGLLFYSLYLAITINTSFDFRHPFDSLAILLASGLDWLSG